MKLLTTKQVAIRIAIIISAIEMFIMLMLQAVPNELNTYIVAVLDTASLLLLSTPSIYFWVIKPFVDARDEALAQISHMALTDPLTQLANRRLVLEHLNKVIAGCIRHKEHGAVLLIDLDGFKLINDNHGHGAGDAVLIEIAKRLLTSIRSKDIVGRMGGDEFIVLLDRLEADARIAHDQVMQFANKLIAIINMPIQYNTISLHVDASIGICLLGFEQQNAETAINESDSAMYRAKEAGGGCVIFFEK